MKAEEPKKIGVTVATIVGMNAMIGSGIFVVPAALASHVGPAGIITYAFVIVAVWCLGTSIARLAQLYPQEGSFYLYAKQWGGHIAGLLAAGFYLIGLLIAMGLLAQSAGIYLVKFLPFLSAKLWGIIILIALTILNMYGVILSETGQLILICTTILPLIITTILCFSKAQISNLIPFAPYGYTNILAATKAVIFGFFGFECAASLFNLVEYPEKNVSRALTLSITLVGILYLLFVMSLILAIPTAYFSSDIPLPETLHILFPNYTWIILLIHCSILSAILGTIHSMIWSSSELLVSYIRQFRSSFSKTYIAPYVTQRIAVLFVGASITTTCLVFNNVDLFFNCTALFIVSAFVLSIITLLVLPQEWHSGRNNKTIIGLLAASIIFYFALEGIIANMMG